MYKRILVALDGSELAERILPHVEALGRALGSTLIVLRATTPPEKIIAELNAGTMLPAAGIIDPVPFIDAEREEVDAYLARIADRLRGSGLTVQTERPDRPAAAAILQSADEFDVDLIAMTSHGRTGLGRLVFGSVAGEVLHGATRPLLVVHVNDRADGSRSGAPAR
jgi:nucleotide-binding universal stress UspA family protein